MASSFPALVTVLALLLYVGVFVTAGRVPVLATASKHRPLPGRRNSNPPCGFSRTRLSS